MNGKISLEQLYRLLVSWSLTSLFSTNMAISETTLYRLHALANGNMTCICIREKRPEFLSSALPRPSPHHVRNHAKYEWNKTVTVKAVPTTFNDFKIRKVNHSGY